MLDHAGFGKLKRCLLSVAILDDFAACDCIPALETFLTKLRTTRWDLVGLHSAVGP
jgi:hypothetical protein